MKRFDTLLDAQLAPIDVAFQAKATAIAAVGPTLVTVLGYDFDVLTVAVAFTAVILSRMIARRIAPASEARLPVAYEVVLTLLLCLIAFVVEIDDHKSPYLAVGLGIALGFYGITAVQAIARRYTSVPTEPPSSQSEGPTP